MPNRRDYATAQMLDAFGQMNAAIAERKKKRERDAIAAELAQQYQLQGVDTAEELKMAMELEDWQTKRKYQQAQTQRALREPALRSVPRDEEGLTPYQRKQLELSLKREERLSQPRASRPLTVEDEQTALDKEMRKKFGFDMADVEPILKNGTPVLSDGTVEFSTRAGVPMKLKKDDVLPYMSRAATIYKSRTGSTEAPMNDVVPKTQPAPSATPMPTQPPRTKIELAKQALNDPEATELEKAQARKILGL